MTYSRLLDIFIGFFKSKAFINLITNGETATLEKIISFVELIIEKGFKKHPNLVPKTHRASLLSVLLLSDLSKLKANRLRDRIRNIQTFLNDITKYHRTLEHSYPWVKGSYKIYRKIDPDSKHSLDYQFWRNISTGLAMGYRQLKPHFANNHILIKILDNPLEFTGPVENMLKKMGTVLPDKKTIEVSLENGSRYVDKIDDAGIALEVPKFIMKIGNKSLDLGKSWVRITYDSKFYINPERIADTKNVAQQIQLTFQDRVKDDLAPVLKKIIDSDLTPMEQAESVKKMIPLMFQHYVVKSSDTRSVSSTVKDAYANAFKTEGKAHFEAVLHNVHNLDIGNHPNIVNALFKAIDDHAENHFRSGAFVLEKSDLKYFDFPD